MGIYLGINMKILQEKKFPTNFHINLQKNSHVIHLLVMLLLEHFNLIRKLSQVIILVSYEFFMCFPFLGD